MRLFLFVVLGVASLGWSQTSSTDSVSRRYLLVPFGGYSEETGAQIGGLGMYFLPGGTGDGKGSSLTASAVFTTRGQRMAMLGPTFVLDGGRTELSTFSKYSDWPGNYWMGGNAPSALSEGYSMTSVGVRGSALFSADYLGLPDQIRGGVLHDVERNSTEFGSDARVNAGLRMGGWRVGIGPVLQWDTRDHKGGPTRGALVSLGTVFFDDSWGSDWNFSKTTLDLRGYQAIGSRCVLALGAMWERVDGDVPFDRLAMPDGVSRLRGVEKGWLRDRQQFVAQSELRFPTPWWISGVAFAEMGKVGDDFEELAGNRFHYALGGGVRLPVNRERRLNFRLDLAWVGDGMGAAASFGEAF